MYYYDTETCGLHGPIVLLQYAENDGPVTLHSVWHESMYDTMNIIEEMMYHDEGVCGFNLAFDHFHVCQMYTTMSLMIQRGSEAEKPPMILEYAASEADARLGPCIKPVKALDLMLHARKGPYQSMMDRKEIRLKRVPAVIATELVKEMDKRIPFDDIYFARAANPKDRWKIHDLHDDLDDLIPDFKDVVLKFKPSSALKAIMFDTGLRTKDTRLMWQDVAVDKQYRPKELGYAPFATAIGKPGDNVASWNGAWPAVIQYHIDHWQYNKMAREYAEDDVIDTRNLHHFFGYLDAGLTKQQAKSFIEQGGYPRIPIPAGDDDSELACMVGAVRWRGYALNIDKVKKLRKIAEAKIKGAKYNFFSSKVCKAYLLAVMDDTERLVLNVNGKVTTKGVILEDIATWTLDTVCTECRGMGCLKCDDGLIHTETRHEAAKRASEILTVRRAKKEIELYDKLILAGRFHASFNVIGAFSNRMSGSDGLNPQGIKSDFETRSCFELADQGMVLCGGDFSGSQVAIADAVYQDPVLHAKLISGKKIHALFGTCLFPTMSYDEILATKGLPNERDKYGRSKNGVFAMLFGGEAYTLQHRVGISEAAANKAYQSWIDEHVVWGEERKKYFDMFCSMRQPGGIGTKVVWHDAADYIESMFGFKRYFTIENNICRTLFQLANDPPKAWKDLSIRVVRRDRVQTASGATQSALFAAAFAVQAANMRAAANHVIQSPEASFVKSLQRRLWDLQTPGIGVWMIQPINIHDELMCAAEHSIPQHARVVVETFIEEMKVHVPLIGIKWMDKIDTWAAK